MNRPNKYEPIYWKDDSGFALPLVLMILFLIGLMQLRLAARVRELTLATAFRTESVRALTEARNLAVEAVYLNRVDTTSVVRRAATLPIRIESLTSESQIGDSIKRFEIFTLSPASSGPPLLPDWQTLRANEPVSKCRSAAGPQFISSVSCLVDNLDLRRIYEGNLIARSNLVLSLNDRLPAGIFATGEIFLDSLEINSSGRFQLEIAAIGDLKIRKLVFKYGETDSPIGSTILLHSSRGKVEVGSLEGISACFPDSPPAVVRLAVQFAASAKLGSNPISGVGRGGCPVSPRPERFKAIRTVGAGAK